MTAASATPDGEAPAASIGKYWWLPLVAGVLTVLVGFAAIAYPGPTLLVVGLLFGGYLAVWGTMTVIHGATGEGLPVVGRVLLIFLGVLGVLAGLLLIDRPGESVLTFVWVLGFWWVLPGVLQIARGIVKSEGRAWNLIIGLLGLVAGTIILASPRSAW